MILSCCRDATLNWCWDATLSWCWDAALRCDSQFKTLRSRWMLPGVDMSDSLDACLAHIELEIRAAYLGHWRAYKWPGSLNSQSLDYSSILIRPASQDQKLTNFLRTHKASSFFKSFQRFSPSRWHQNLRNHCFAERRYCADHFGWFFSGSPHFW